jgi:beta-N-acetylhexosaminidase
MHPIMLDVAGCELTAQEQEVIGHPLTGGVILFARNYYDPQQLRHLTAQIKASSAHPILISVDQEGGRVQRFSEGFSRVPAMGSIAANAVPEALANACGTVIAAECLGHGVDISFAPVLDINGISEVIGKRSFSTNVSQIDALARDFIKGMTQWGMPAIGKHFPGHGNVQADSHIAMPVDERSEAEIFEQDMAVFARLIHDDLLAGMMPAHVVYPNIDDQPAGFSIIWLQQILRQKLGFQGVIFSDDLSMHAATQAGDMLSRVEHALAAGVDMALICNAPDEAIKVLDNLGHSAQHQAQYSTRPQGLVSVNAQTVLHYQQLLAHPSYKAAVERIQRAGN